MKEFIETDWFWIVGGDEARAFSSKSGAYVSQKSDEFQQFIADGTQPTRIASEEELGDVLADYSIRPVESGVLDAYKGRHANKITLEVVAKILFFLVNEIRTLKGQQPIGAQQFKAFVKGLM